MGFKVQQVSEPGKETGGVDKTYFIISSQTSIDLIVKPQELFEKGEETELFDQITSNNCGYDLRQRPDGPVKVKEIFVKPSFPISTGGLNRNFQVYTSIYVHFIGNIQVVIILVIIIITTIIIIIIIIIIQLLTLHPKDRTINNNTSSLFARKSLFLAARAALYQHWSVTE